MMPLTAELWLQFSFIKILAQKQEITRDLYMVTIFANEGTAAGVVPAEYDLIALPTCLRPAYIERLPRHSPGLIEQPHRHRIEPAQPRHHGHYRRCYTSVKSPGQHQHCAASRRWYDRWCAWQRKTINDRRETPGIRAIYGAILHVLKMPSIRRHEIALLHLRLQGLEFAAV